MGKISDIKNSAMSTFFEHSGCYNADTDEKTRMRKDHGGGFLCVVTEQDVYSKSLFIRRTRDSEEEYDTFFDEKNQLINEFNEMARTMSNRSCAFYIKCRKKIRRP